MDPPPLPPLTSRVFVTVGTTRFDSLVQRVCQRSFLDLLHNKLGTTKVLIQYGNASIDTLKILEEASKVGRVDGITLSGYSLKPEGIYDDIQQADLVISHAGAGSIMETLRVSRERNDKTKPILCVVCNNMLMGNHQQELADAIRPYALVANSPDQLEEAIISLNDTLPKLVVYHKPDGMQRLVDAIYDMFP